MADEILVALRSRYARGCRIARDSQGRAYFTSRKLLAAPTRSDDMFHTVKQGDTLMKIAWIKYRDPQKAYIIGDYAIQDGHRMLFPDRDMQPGMVLRMPSPERAELIIASREG